MAESSHRRVPLSLSDLPAELIDLIINHLLHCPQHPNPSSQSLCYAWHAPSLLPPLLPIRLVSHHFNTSLTPALFANINLRTPSKRLTHLSSLSRADHLTEHITTLRLETSPRDLGPVWLEHVHGYPFRDRALAYFDELSARLPHTLACFTRVSTLHLTVSYDGLHLAGISREELLRPCFDMLCAIVKAASFEHLEELQLGMPYEGGYAAFFGECWTERNRDSVRDIAGNGTLRTANVKLSDWNGSFTIMNIGAGL